MKFAFILSEDSHLANKQAFALLEEYRKNSTLPVEKKVYWADEGLGSNFWQDLSIAGLEPKSLVLIVRNAQVILTDTWKKISETLGTLREHVLPIFCVECTWDNKGNVKVPAALVGLKCFTFAEKKQWNFAVAPLNPKTMSSYIRKGLKERQLECSEKVLVMLESALSPQAALIDNTLDQLVLLSENNKVTEENLKPIAAAVPEIMMFDYIKLLENGKSFGIWQQYLAENDAESIFFPFLGILLREARLLWQVLALESVKLPPFILDSKKNTAYKLGREGITHFFGLLFEAEWSVKSGRLQVNQALEALLISLSQLYTRKNL